jgi:pantothenate kinase type III
MFLPFVSIVVDLGSAVCFCLSVVGVAVVFSFSFAGRW